MAAATIGVGASGSFLLMGFARNGGWSWTFGGLLYVDAATPGAIVQVAPGGANNVVQVVGVATSATKIYLNPCLVMVEHV